MSIYKNGKLVAGGSQALPLLSFMWADHKFNDVSWLRADTFSWQAGSVYEAAYQHLVDDINNAEIASIWNDSYKFDRDVADDDLAREAPYAWKHGSRIVYTKSDKPKINDTIYEVDPQSTYGTVVAVVPVYRTEIVNGITIQFYLAADGHKICPASEESNVMAIYNATGVAWYYIIDTTNQRFKLPRTKFGFTGIRTGVGKYVEAGIPNITGAFWIDSYYAASPDGAFTATDNYSAPNHGNWAAEGWRIHLDASRASSVYGNSDTVQPKATEMYLYFYVGNFTQTALENTAGLNTELFNGKADLNLLNTASNVDFVVERQEPTAGNNYTWYRKYKSGWVEQGGQTPKDTGGSSVTLPVAMADANYSISCTLKNATTSTSTGGYDRYPGVSVITTTGFWVDQPSKADYYTCWEVKGMAA